MAYSHSVNEAAKVSTAKAKYFLPWWNMAIHEWTKGAKYPPPPLSLFDIPYTWRAIGTKYFPPPWWIFHTRGGRYSCTGTARSRVSLNVLTFNVICCSTKHLERFGSLVQPLRFVSYIERGYLWDKRNTFAVKSAPGYRALYLRKKYNTTDF